MGAMLSIFAVVILFWAIFKQNGSALNTWASRYTERHVSGTTGSLLTSLKQTETIQYSKDSMVKMDHQFRKLKEGGQELQEFTYPSYFKNIEVTEIPAEGAEIKVWAAKPEPIH